MLVRWLLIDLMMNNLFWRNTKASTVAQSTVPETTEDVRMLLCLYSSLILID